MSVDVLDDPCEQRTKDMQYRLFLVFSAGDVRLYAIPYPIWLAYS